MTKEDAAGEGGGRQGKSEKRVFVHIGLLDLLIFASGGKAQKGERGEGKRKR